MNTNKTNQLSAADRGHDTGGAAAKRRRATRWLFLLSLIFITGQQISAGNLWSDGFKAWWDRDEAAYTFKLRFYDSTGRDDAIRNGLVGFGTNRDLDRIIEINTWHQDFPYKVDVRPKNGAWNKYDIKVKDGATGTWKSLPHSEDYVRVQYTSSESSGSGSFYYVEVSVAPINWYSVQSCKQSWYINANDIDRNATIIDHDCRHTFTDAITINANYTYQPTISDIRWADNQQLATLNWNGSQLKNNGDTKINYVKIFCNDKEIKNYDSKHIPGDNIDLNAVLADAGISLADMMHTSHKFKLEVSIQPKFWNDNAHTFSVEKWSETLAQPQNMTVVGVPESETNPQSYIDIAWNVVNAGNNTRPNVPFKLERYRMEFKTDNDKTDTTYHHEYTKEIPYAAGQNDYKYTDYDLPKEGICNYEYRLSRNGGMKGYPLLNTEGYISTQHVSPDSIKLNLTSEGTAVEVRWLDNDAIWSKGTKAVLTQINLTDGGSKTELKTFNTYAEYADKFYLDERVKVCNTYVYSMEVKLPEDTEYEQKQPVESKNSVVPYKIGSISGIKASKGYFNDRTEISWHCESAFDNFLVYRKVYGSDADSVQIGSVKYESTYTDFVYEDKKGSIGTIYQYYVHGITDCDGDMKLSNVLDVVGFRTSTGVISGRVTYENGQAVKDVEIIPQTDNQTIGMAARLDGQGYVVSDNSLALPANAFTLETYLRPDGSNAGNTLMAVGDDNLLNFNNEGQLIFNLNGKIIADTVKHAPDTYYHISAVYTGSEMLLYVDTLLVGRAEVAGVDIEAGNLLIGASRSGENYSSHYTGYIDEVRVWNKALTEAEIKMDFTRQLYGGEKGLMLYYRFNEGVSGEVYDMSFEGDVYHEMHATAVNMRYVSDAAEMPSMEQLFIKGVSDSNGNYIINGVPYASNGTQYRVIPRYGTHQFNPTEKLINMSETSRNFTADFVDKSSFVVKGRVLYSESNIPVPGVMFEIDGIAASVDNKVVQTGSDGEFTISVPVGKHEVRAVKQNHTFRNDGRLVDANGEDLFYGDTKDGVVFRDETRVRLVGRLAGGPVQEAFPLGHSQSVNNLGEKLGITLTLTGGRYDIYDDEIPIDADNVNEKVVFKTVKVEHLRPGYWEETEAERATETTEVTYGKGEITIVPSANTGEFYVDLIPTSYDVKEATATKHGNILDGVMTMNLADSLFERSISYEYIVPEELREEGKDTIAVDSIVVNAGTQFIKRVAPTLLVNQLGKSGTPLDYWGDTVTVVNNVMGEMDTIAIFDRSEEGDARYLFETPVMNQQKTYFIKAEVFENYEYYEVGSDEPEWSERVPVTDGVVKFDNDISKRTVDTVHVKSDGIAYYSFVCGEPRISGDTKKLEVTVQIADRTIDSKTVVNAIVLGSQQSNNNFITAGPNVITTVLRDPPGSNSYSYLEAGTAYEYSSSYIGSMELSQEAGVEVSTGITIHTSVGLGAEIHNTAEVENDNVFTAVFEENVEGTEGTVSRMSFTNRWQTSEDPAYVGADADVYIGKSTNVIMGKAMALEILRDGEFDTELLGDDAVKRQSNGYSLVSRETMNMGVSFKTAFAYPQIHIEEVIIPQLKDLMAQQFSALTPEQAQEKANSTQKLVYTTSITDKESENFGKEGYYKVYIPENIDKDGSLPGSYFAGKPENSNLDTVSTIRQSIDNWIMAISDNERKKIDAETSAENLSFHAGANIERTMEYSGSDVNVISFSIKTGAHQDFRVGAAFNAVGVKTTVNLVEAMSHGGEFSTTQEATRSFGFVLAEDGTDYISVDVKRVNNDQKLDQLIKDGGGDFGIDYSDLLDTDELKGDQDEYVFLTRGGATSCPWEDGYQSKYYEEGTQIDQPTAQMEKPVLSVKESTVTNVPSSRRAVFELQLGNESETGDDQYFMLSLIDESNPNGAKFFIDGGALLDGRTFLVPAGGTLVKTLEVEKGTADVYENLQLSLHSLCQYDPTGFQDLIESTVSINVEFVPSCSDLTLASPLDKWVLNTNSSIAESGQYYVPVKVNNFDVNYENFHHIDIQLKPTAASDDKWVTKVRYYKSQDDADADRNATCEKRIISGSEIIYNMEFDSINDVDQQYDICAVSACLIANEYVETVTEVATGTKDTYTPRLFGQPQPADGILGVEDEILLNFNEMIAAGYIVPGSNVRAKGIRNGSLNTYSASVNFDGVSEYAETELPKNYTNKSFTIETNIVNADIDREAVVFAMGNMEIGFAADRYLQVKVGGTTVKSLAPIDFQNGEWEHLAVVYEHADQPAVTAYYNLKQVIGAVPVDPYSGTGNYVIAAGLNKDRFFKGKLNEFRIWTDALSMSMLNKNRGIVLSGAEANLQAYYPMSAGKGNVLTDDAGGNHAVMHATWSINNPGLAAYFFGKSHAKYSMSQVVVTDDMDYTLEFWFKADKQKSGTTAMVSTGKADARDNNAGSRQIYVGFENGKLVTRNNGYKNEIDIDLCDNQWHHYALTVSRTMDKASVFIDGELASWFTASNIDGISADQLTVGACNWTKPDGADGIGTPVTDDYFTGQLDELRLWNMSMNKTLLNLRNNTRVDKNEMGLLMYVPFEKYVTASGLNDMVFTLDNQTETTAQCTNVGVLESADAANIKEVVEQTSISVDVVANNDALIINPDQSNSWNDFEQRIITFTVAGIRDMNGNEMEGTVSWTAFIDRNHIKWSDDEMTIECNEYEGADFEADIVNIGGMYQNFTLQNIPGWLDVSAESGSVGPKASVTLKFHVSEALNVGLYDHIVYLINDNGVARALNITVKVKGETPEWSVDPSKYEYNMNIYGKLKVNNIFSSDAEDMLAAFHNGECVGVAHNTYVKKYDMWYTLLTVYGNLPSHTELEFRIWDASTGTIYIGEPDETIFFKNDVIKGSPVDPIVFSTKEMRIQNIALNEGWNWISYNVNNGTNDFRQMFSNGDWATGDQIKDETNNTFASYATEGWTGPLADKVVSYKNMYLVKSSGEQVISLTGTPLRTKEERTIELRPQWNYIAFLPTANLTVQEAFAGYEASEGDIVKDQSSFAMYSEAIGWLGSLEYMKPGVGYMFYRSAADSAEFIYPLLTANEAARNNSKAKALAPAAETFAYPANMSVVAVVDAGFELLPGDRIVALVGDERRGTAVSVANPADNSSLYYITVGGETSAAVTFAVERAGEIVAESRARVEFAPDAVVGDIDNPYVISFAEGTECTVYPTLFTDELNVALSNADNAGVDIRLIDMNGRVLRSYSQTDNSTLFTIDGLDQLPAGMYVVEIQIDGQSTVHKVEKKQ